MNVSRAKQVFTNSNLTKWIPVQNNLRNTTVKFVKNDDIIEKVVTRKDGTEVIGRFKDGKLISADYDNVRGNIHTDFAPDNSKLPERFQAYKTTTITLEDGNKLTRSNMKDGGVEDVWQQRARLVKAGKFDALYNEYKNIILKGNQE